MATTYCTNPITKSSSVKFLKHTTEEIQDYFNKLDIIPHGWNTAKDISKIINKSVSHTRELLIYSYRNNLIEREKFKIKYLTGIYSIWHFRIKNNKNNKNNKNSWNSFFNKLDIIPHGWNTAKDISKIINKSVSTVKVNLNYGIENKLIEWKTFKKQCRNGIHSTPYYHLIKHKNWNVLLHLKDYIIETN